MAMYGNLDAVRAGTLDGLNHIVISKRADVGFSFGEPVFVAPGNETDGVLPDSTDATLKFQGVAIHTYFSDNTVEGEYPENHMLPVCTEGEIWVQIVDGITACANKPAYIVDLTSDGDYKLFTDTSGATTYTPGCVFTSNPVTTGSGGTLKTFAKIYVDGLA